MIEEIFRNTECGLYQVSNHYNIKTAPYKFYKGTELIESKNEIIPIADDRKIKERNVTILHTGFGYSPTKIAKRVREVFTNEELNIVTDV